MEYAINHILNALLREGAIYKKTSPGLFDAADRQQGAVRERLADLGLEFILLLEAGVAHARVMPDDALAHRAEELGVEQISPVCSHKRMTWFDSATTIYFRSELDNEMREGGEPRWIPQEEVYETVSRFYSRNVALDDIAMKERIAQSLARLETMGLLATRAMGPATVYRGREIMMAAVSVDDVRAFTEASNNAADQAAREGSQEAAVSEATGNGAGATSTTGKKQPASARTQDPDPYAHGLFAFAPSAAIGNPMDMMAPQAID